jgi:hypothetical protein
MPLPFGKGIFSRFHQKTGIKMYELFIELTNQIFWDGYAQQLAKENPAAFQLEFAEFANSYNREIIQY